MRTKLKSSQRRVPCASMAITLLAVITLFSCSQKTLAQQWSTSSNGNDISNTNSGNVGIGTTSPASKLVVKGADGTSTNSALNVTDSSNNSILSVRNDGRVSVGTTNPFSFFHVKALGNWLTHPTPKGSVTQSGSLFDFIYSDSSSTNASLTSSEAFIDLVANPSAGKSINGISSLPLVPTSNSAALSNLTLRGIDSSPSFQGTGSIQQLQGIRLVSENANTGSMFNLQGVVSQVQNLNAAGVVTNVIGVDTWMPNNIGTVTNYFGARINSLSNPGTITNTYGVYVGDISAGTQTTKPFSFYASDPNTNNYFAGFLGIGTTAPTRPFEVSSSLGDVARLHRSVANAGWGLNIKFALNNSVGSVIDYAGVAGGIASNTAGAEGGNLAFYTITNGIFTEKMRITSAGDLGIGTAAPSYKLDVAGEIRSSAGGFRFPDGSVQTTAAGIGAVSSVFGRTGAVVQQAGDYTWAQITKTTSSLGDLQTRSAADLNAGTVPIARLGVSGIPDATTFLRGDNTWTPVPSSQWTNGANNISFSSGNVGIGTSTPDATFAVSSNIGDGSFAASISNANIFGYGMRINTAHGSSDTTRPTLSVENNGIPILQVLGAGPTSLFGNGDQYAAFIKNTGAYGFGLRITSGPSTNGRTALLVENASSTSLLQVQNNGNVGIGTTTPGTKLEVVGNINVTGTGNITANGTIEGGNIKVKYQDVAEWVESSQELSAGTLVVLDHTNSNQVIASTQAYDTRVAGVISERPGIALGEAGDNKVLVATTGRVRLMVDASKGPIQIGDLLVTSDISGVAMKSEAINVGGVQIHRPGTLIGKALEPLIKGRGEILVLLSLQ